MKFRLVGSLSSSVKNKLLINVVFPSPDSPIKIFKCLKYKYKTNNFNELSTNCH